MFVDVEIIKIFPRLKFYVSPKIFFIEASGILHITGLPCLSGKTLHVKPLITSTI